MDSPTSLHEFAFSYSVIVSVLYSVVATVLFVCIVCLYKVLYNNRIQCIIDVATNHTQI